MIVINRLQFVFVEIFGFDKSSDEAVGFLETFHQWKRPSIVQIESNANGGLVSW